MADRDRVEVLRLQTGVAERLTDDGGDPLEVRAAGDLGHDTRVALVQLVLRGDRIAEDVASGGNDGCRRFVTAGLDPQDDQPSIGRSLWMRTAGA